MSVLLFDSTYIASIVGLIRHIVDDHRDAERGDEADTVAQQLQHSTEGKVGPVAASIAPPQAPLVQNKAFKTEHFFNFLICLSFEYISQLQL